MEGDSTVRLLAKLGPGVVIVKASADYDFDTRDHETVSVFHAIAGHVDADPT